jgi:hypothetical protein
LLLLVEVLVDLDLVVVEVLEVSGLTSRGKLLVAALQLNLHCKLHLTPHTL